MRAQGHDASSDGSEVEEVGEPPVYVWHDDDAPAIEEDEEDFGGDKDDELSPLFSPSFTLF